MKKRILKIVAGVIGLCLIGFLLFITNAFVGNPISAALANNSIRDYVSENYTELDLELSKAQFNFKDGSYVVKATSNTSQDTHFHIHYRNGEIHYDSYDSYVLGKFNTLSRMQDECTKQVIPILTEIKEINAQNSYVIFEEFDKEDVTETIKLDMDYDKSLPIDMTLFLKVGLEDNSFENIAALLKETHEVMLDKGYVFSTYNVDWDNLTELIVVYGVTVEDVESDNLEQRLIEGLEYEKEQSEKQKDKEIIEGIDKETLEERISVFIKKK